MPPDPLGQPRAGRPGSKTDGRDRLLDQFGLKIRGSWFIRIGEHGPAYRDHEIITIFDVADRAEERCAGQRHSRSDQWIPDSPERTPSSR
jgi:hypothetical protein